jgi:hypothetical protein
VKAARNAAGGVPTARTQISNAQPEAAAKAQSVMDWPEKRLPRHFRTQRLNRSGFQAGIEYQLRESAAGSRGSSLRQVSILRPLCK